MRRNSILLLPAGALTGLASAQSSGDINVLTMNVAGLPAILQGNDVPGDKTVNSRLIGAKLVQHGYDVVNVQEDFNYHAALYSTATLPFRTATSGGVPFGSGLNTLSQHEIIDTVRVKWDTCSNDSGSDCLTPKGFTLTRLAVSDDAAQGAAFVDVYNFHTDAGTAAGDLTARTATGHPTPPVTLADGTVLARGGTGGTASELVLAANERWTAATLCQGKRNDRTRIFSIEARTSAGRTLRAGTTTSECCQFTAPAGWAIVGFLGRGGDEIDRLGFLYARQ
ncbi:hypothetical protein BN1708_013341 [Verticillium longisporum]|uniref:Jacalin-type lectin domain-containing protein n=1 Tax=Verticillium longisporum TaxID=100787 RepID=A0A0G4LJH5_VERLO|nr:hypothetical protein BN1708_013341 [Verticillium longisporum]